MKIDLNKQAVDLTGKPIEGTNGNLGKNIASFLSFAVKGTRGATPIKLWDWSMSLYKGEPVEMDDADKDIIIALIEQSEDLSVSMRAQAIRVIKKQAEEQSPK